MAGKRWPLKSRMVDALLCLCFYVGCIVSMWMGKSEWWGCHSTGRILRREGMVWVVGEILMGKCLCSGNAFGGIEFEKLLKQVESKWRCFGQHSGQWYLWISRKRFCREFGCILHHFCQLLLRRCSNYTHNVQELVRIIATAEERDSRNHFSENATT